MGAADVNDPFTPDLGEFIAETTDEWKVAGLSIAVVDGESVFSKGFGYATLPDIPATPETLWYGGSTTKAFTTATLAHLIDSGKYPALSDGWQTKVSSIIRDDFVTQDEWATNNLTLEDLASHRSGLSNNDSSILLHENGRPWEVRDIVRNLRNFPLRSQPRTEFDYNNEGYSTLSYIIEKITGRWLGDVLADIIWKPLGMNSTYFDLQQARDAPEHLSTGYYWDTTDERYKSIPPIPTDIVSGAGAIISNVIDYTKWIKYLLGKGAPLPDQVHRDIRKPRFIHDPDPAHGMDVSLYGLSWWRTSINGHVVYWHSGSTTSHGALVYWLPEWNYGVVILANRPSQAGDIIMRRLVYDKLGVPQGKRYDIAKDLRNEQRKREEDIENAAHTLFPDLPPHPQPPSLDVERFTGKYYAPGHGVFKFALRQDGAALREMVLVAYRTNLLWKSRITLCHISGDFWVMFVTLINGGRLPEMFLAAEFRVGVDGEPSGLVIIFPDRKQNGGRVFLERLLS